jgi:putative tricarboxylic transport membrane protein
MEKKADRISGVLGLLFAIFMGIQSYGLGLGTLHKPGPGFLFFWTSIALGGLSLVVLIRALIDRRPGEQGNIFDRQNLGKTVLVLVSVFVYAILMESIGFILVTLMLFLFLLGIIEKKKWSLTIFISVAVTVVSYLIFEVWLRSQLPKGLLEFIRF